MIGIFVCKSTMKVLFHRTNVFKNRAKDNTSKHSNRILDSWLVDSLSLPPTLTRFVHLDVLNVLKLIVVKEKLMKCCVGSECSTYSQKEINQFIDRILENPAYKRRFFLMLECISKKGLLKVLLTVYLKLLASFAKQEQKGLAKKESLKIFKFVASLASLKKWNPEDVKFQGDLFSFVVVPVAVRSSSALEIYAKRIEMYSGDRNTNAIFVVAIGPYNEFVAKKTAESFYRKNSEEFIIRFKSHYDVFTCKGNKTQGTTILLTRAQYQ